MNHSTKRLFFGAEVQAPWPDTFPPGRLLAPQCRHLTLAFLGNIEYAPLEQRLVEIPTPTFKVGQTGYFDRCLLLPPQHSRVVAWHVNWFESEILSFQQQLAMWLRQEGYSIEERPFLSHVTLARSPFDTVAWSNAFVPLPMMTTGIHLYESLGNSTYKPIWTLPLVAPIEELDHTTDIAFRLSASSLSTLQLHAQVALAFKFSPLLNYFPTNSDSDSLEDIVIALNDMIANADSEQRCPFKAVSFCGDIVEKGDLLQWEMIVDA
jgi:2'-5' RNA ligase